MASRFATRPGRPSVNSTRRHNARNYAESSNYSDHSHAHAHSENNEGGEENESTFPVWKTIGVGVVVVACFAMVYPKMFHPMLMYALGYGQPTQNNADPDMHQHPSMKHGPHPGAGLYGGHQDADRKQGVHAGPHPASRMGGHMPGMGAGLHHAAEGGRGGGKSMWHWLLPFYTVGVIIFLLYTLSKILWKKPEAKVRRQYDVRYNMSRDRFETNHPNFAPADEELEGEEDANECMYDGYENARDDGSNGRRSNALSNGDLRNLQQRLQETESAMHNILSQLEQLSTTVDPTAADNIKKMTMETLDNLGKISADSQGRQPKAHTPVEDFDEQAEEEEDTYDNQESNFSLGGRLDGKEARYMKDLDTALTDFKRFTENYIQEHTKKQKGQSKNTVEEANKENEEIDTADLGFDTMESESGQPNGDLKMEPGEGELIAVSGEDDSPASNSKVSSDDSERSGQNRPGGKNKKKKQQNVRQRKHAKIPVEE